MLPKIVLGFASAIFPQHRDGKIIGAYAIHHPGMNMFYIGSSGNLYARRAYHESTLRTNQHFIKLLQQHYSIEPCVEFTCWPTSRREDAFAVEQELVNLLTQTNRLYNKGSDVIKPATGLALSDEHRRIISQTHRGKVVSVETRRKMSQSRPGPMSLESKNKFAENNPHMVRKVMIDGVEYSSVADAARKLGIPKTTILYRLQPKITRYATWFYIDG